MNIYLLEQEENTDYDVFSACVVAAEDYLDAADISPEFNNIPAWLKEGEEADWSCSWATKKENVRVTLLGKAREGTMRGVLLSSFHAG